MLHATLALQVFGTGDTSDNSSDEGRTQLMFDSGLTESRAMRSRQSCSHIEVVAHRGATYSYDYYAPENTFASTAEAVRLGATVIEVDVQVTLDGVHVLLHDSTVDRTTNGTGSINQMTWAEVQTLEAVHPFWKGEPQRVPSFAESLLWARDFGVDFDLHMKSNQVESALQIIQDMGVQHHVFMTSSNSDVIARTRAFDPTIRIMPKTTGVESTLENLALFDPKPEQMEIKDGGFTPENIALMHQNGVKVFMNSLGVRDVLAVLGNTQGFAQLVDAGIDLIQTDFPATLTDYLQAKCGK